MSRAKSHLPIPSELIILLDSQLYQRSFTDDELYALSVEFDKSQEVFHYDTQETRAADAYEFNGLVLFAAGDYAGAYGYFTEALKLIGNNALYSQNAGRWYYEQNSRITSVRKSKNIRRIIGVIVTIAVIAWIGFTSWYDSDTAVIARADPYMMSLADSASMTERAKAIFARTSPTLVDSATMQELCQSDVTGDVVEQGCFDPNSERIYIRDLPTDLDQGEVTTAAHEMLHAAMDREGMSNDEASALTTDLADPATNEAMSSLLTEYGGISEETRLQESQAFLGTTYAQLMPEMESYYAKYFSDGRQALLNAYAAVKSIFEARKQALIAEEQNIQKTYNNAEIYYANHAYYARTGNRYGYENSYSLYSQTYDSYSRQVDQYNIDAQNYNELLAGYAGVPVSQLKAQSISN